MQKDIILKKYILVLVVLLLPFNGLFSEGLNHKTRTTTELAKDKRLPPVVPGESVSDGKKSMKVWSTAGPVPVTKLDRDVDSPNFEPPRAPRPNRRKNINDLPVNVIVDGR
jgi:hypothetical protein